MRPALFVLGLCLLAGCSKDETQQPAQKCGKSCSTATFTPVFENYAPEEMDSVRVRHYKPDGTFSVNSLLSEKVYTLADTVRVYDDAGQLLGIAFRSLLLTIGEDHEVDMYAPVRTYRIWNIQETEETQTYDCNDKSFTCIGKPESYSFSGGLQRVERTSAGVYLVLTH